jgi:hypothetical protein
MQAGRKTERHKHKLVQTDRQEDMHTGKKDRYTGMTDKQADRQEGKQTDRQAAKTSR